jgi:acyl-ACP thioesterase
MSGLPEEAVGDAWSLTVPYRARFDECGPDDLVRASALLRYAQDVAWIHSERLGFTRAWYSERHLGWVVRTAELAILAPLPLGEVIAMRTEVVGFRRFWARRLTEGRLGDGSLAVRGRVDWVIIDTARGVPGRLPPEFLARFDRPSSPFEPGRVTLAPPPDEGVSVTTMRVRPQDLDPMGHMNNAAYLDCFEECLLAAGGESAALTTLIPRRFCVEYLQPAALGSTLTGRTWPLEAQANGVATSGCAWLLEGEQGGEVARGIVLPDGAASDA